MFLQILDVFAPVTNLFLENCSFFFKQRADSLGKVKAEPPPLPAPAHPPAESGPAAGYICLDGVGIHPFIEMMAFPFLKPEAL